MNAPAAATDERLPVWEALSEFFLDTELNADNYERIAAQLARSRYSEAELQDILWYEVYPACKWNMFSMAGEWAGFGEEWIMQNIAPRKDKRPRFFHWKPFHSGFFQDHWDAVRKRVAELRLAEKT